MRTLTLLLVAIVVLSGCPKTQQPLRVTTTNLPDAQTNVQYVVQLQATGGNPPYVWSLVGGELPPGLTLGALGLLVGVPQQPGLYQFVVSVRDSNFTAMNVPVTSNVKGIQ